MTPFYVAITFTDFACPSSCTGGNGGDSGQSGSGAGGGMYFNPWTHNKT